MKFPIIDLHEDLLLHTNRHELYPDGNIQTSFAMLEAAPAKVVIGSAFPVPPEDNFLDPVANTMIEADFAQYKQYADEHPAWKIVTDAPSLDAVLSSDMHGIIMHIEGLNVLDANPYPRLEKWFAEGWRSLGIVWNVTNPLGGGTTEPEIGITQLGKEILAWAESKHLLIDLAHMNPVIFKDALAATKGPIFVSHGNTCHHCPTPRNYTDEQLRAIADRGGIVGPFFSKKFLVPAGMPVPIEAVVAHFTHLRDIVGIDHIALGTDFGGILSGYAEGLTSVNDLPNLWDAMTKAGFTESQLEQIAWKNAAAFLRAALPQ